MFLRWSFGMVYSTRCAAYWARPRTRRFRWEFRDLY